MKTNELIGEKLDYWVAKAEGWKCKIDSVLGGPNHGKIACQVWVPPSDKMHGYNIEFPASTEWIVGGPIIEREVSELRRNFKDGRTEYAWIACALGSGGLEYTGPTPLVAAMRAYVASKFGEEVPDIE